MTFSTIVANVFTLFITIVAFAFVWVVLLFINIFMPSKIAISCRLSDEAVADEVVSYDESYGDKSVSDDESDGDEADYNHRYFSREQKKNYQRIL